MQGAQAASLWLRVRAQAAGKHTHGINTEAHPSPSHSPQVSGLFQSQSTPNNTNLEKASSYIPAMQLQKTSAARQIYKLIIKAYLISPEMRGLAFFSQTFFFFFS